MSKEAPADDLRWKNCNKFSAVRDKSLWWSKAILAFSHHALMTVAVHVAFMKLTSPSHKSSAMLCEAEQRKHLGVLFNLRSPPRMRQKKLNKTAHEAGAIIEFTKHTHRTYKITIRAGCCYRLSNDFYVCFYALTVHR